VKLDWNVARLTGLLSLMAVMMVGAACGGISAGGSASPATFLLPGIGQNTPQRKSPSPAKDQKASPVLAYSADSAELPQ